MTYIIGWFKDASSVLREFGEDVVWLAQYLVTWFIDSLPYLMMMAALGIAGLYFFSALLNIF